MLDRVWFAVSTGRVDTLTTWRSWPRGSRRISVEQLYHDALPDIYLDRRPPETLVEPLSSGVFPQDKNATLGH
ncbi:MAG: hypothetical protein KatS3mg112_0609 [Thermogutta sp.]|nr:MAG: hypothetical protein KatS3mg112_0609 [Thermogutta sp.]